MFCVCLCVRACLCSCERDSKSELHSLKRNEYILTYREILVLTKLVNSSGIC